METAQRIQAREVRPVARRISISKRTAIILVIALIIAVVAAVLIEVVIVLTQPEPAPQSVQTPVVTHEQVTHVSCNPVIYRFGFSDATQVKVTTGYGLHFREFPGLQSKILLNLSQNVVLDLVSGQPVCIDDMAWFLVTFTRDGETHVGWTAASGYDLNSTFEFYLDPISTK